MIWNESLNTVFLVASKWTEVGRRRMEFHSLAVALAMANTHFYLGKKLDEAWRGEFKKELYKSLDFWSYTLRAHFQTAILHLCRVYDERRKDDTHHLLHLVEKIDDSNLTDLQRQQKTMDFSFLQKSKPNEKVAKLRKWRNNYFAHNNYILAIDGMEDFLKKNPVDLQEIQSLIDNGFSILERWAIYYDFKGEFPRFVERKDDYQFVLESLRFGLIQKTRQ